MSKAEHKKQDPADSCSITRAGEGQEGSRRSQQNKHTASGDIGRSTPSLSCRGHSVRLCRFVLPNIAIEPLPCHLSFSLVNVVKRLAVGILHCGSGSMLERSVCICCTTALPTCVRRFCFEGLLEMRLFLLMQGAAGSLKRRHAYPHMVDRRRRHCRGVVAGFDRGMTKELMSSAVSSDSQYVYANAPCQRQAFVNGSSSRFAKTRNRIGMTPRDFMSFEIRPQTDFTSIKPCISVVHDVAGAACDEPQANVYLHLSCSSSFFHTSPS